MEDWGKYNLKFRYMMLSRLVMDCNYYLGNGGRSVNSLWARTEEREIAVMRAIWNTFDPEDRPEWLTTEQIDEYARQMGVDHD